MTYQETIDYLYERLPMFTRIGAAAYKKDLHNTIALLAHLGNPHLQFKSIHVAGTNGKGSTSHMLAAVLHANGYKTGLYTSPHLNDFRERIKVSSGLDNTPGASVDDEGLLQDGLNMVSESFVVDFTERMMPVIDQIAPSFFEVTVAMAFEYFAKEKVDIAIIETGLGGRLDSTNVITPMLSIITNIGWDHMNILGDTLDKIANEKAGIIKQQIPVVIGETLPATKQIFEAKSALENAPLYFAESYEIIGTDLSVEQFEVTFKKTNRVTRYNTDLTGIYQQYNLRNVITSIEILQQQGLPLNDGKIHYGLQHVKVITGLHGRWELIRQHPLLVLDVGHNEDGIKQVLKQIAAMHDRIQIVHIIIGMVKDKEVEKVLKLFPAGYQYYFTNAHIPRAMPAIELKQKAVTFGLNGNVFENVNEAIENALSVSNRKDLLVVCGSVFVAGEVEVERWKNL
jgi:dihydrofolate synthase/folylpolyglutamate synthase